MMVGCFGLLLKLPGQMVGLDKALISGADSIPGTAMLSGMVG